MGFYTCLPISIIIQGVAGKSLQLQQKMVHKSFPQTQQNEHYIPSFYENVMIALL